MPQLLSPYDRESSFLETSLGLAIIISIGLHIVLAWMFLVVFPTLMTNKRNQADEVITVQLFGSLNPPAPAAPPAEVDPNLKGPDVVELPNTAPSPTPQPQFTPVAPDAPASSEAIALGPKPPKEPPKIVKKETPKPKPTVPKIEPDKTKAGPNTDAEINRKMAELKRKVEAEKQDREINSRVANIGKSIGAGTGEGSESGGATAGERIHPEKERYYQHIKDLVSSNWVPPPGALASNLAADYMITIQPDGTVSASNLLRRSGNDDFDISVERAVKMSSPFPPLPPIFNGIPDKPALRFNPAELRRGQQ